MYFSEEEEDRPEWIDESGAVDWDKKFELELEAKSQK